MKEMFKRSFYLCFFFSLLAHVGSIYYDQIKLDWEFKFTKEQEEQVKVMEYNKKIVQGTQHREEDKELLVEHLEKQKEEFVKEAKRKFLQEQQRLAMLQKEKEENERLARESVEQGKSSEKQGSNGGGNSNSSGNKDQNNQGLSEVAKNFSGFINKETEAKVKEEPTSRPINLRYLGVVPKTETIAEIKQCKGQIYVGLGLNLTGDPVNVSNLKDLREYTPWKVRAVAKGYVADKNSIQEGDIFLGIKDKNGVFWEGNRYIAKGVKAGTEVEALFRQKDKVVSKFLRLEEICYEQGKR